MKDDVSVSVIIPNCNNEKYIGEAISSVLASDFSFNRLEIIVVDDASTDNSIKITERHIQANNVTIRLLRNETNIGNAGTKNRGIVNANGKYLFFLDNGYFLEKDCLQRHFDFLENNGDCIACYAPVQDFQTQPGEYRSVWSNQPFDYYKLLRGNYIHAMAMFRAKELRENGLYDIELPPCGLENFELWLRLGKMNKKIGFINDSPLTYCAKDEIKRFFAHSDDKCNLAVQYLRLKYDLQFHHSIKSRTGIFFGPDEQMVAKLFYTSADNNHDGRTSLNTETGQRALDSFIDTNSITLELADNPGFLSFSFKSAEQVSHLRFDPLNDYLQLRIRDIRLIYKGKPVASSFKLSSNAFLDENQIFWFATKTPQIFIDFVPGQNIMADQVILDLEYLLYGYKAISPIIDILNHTITDQFLNTVRMRHLILGSDEHVLQQNPDTVSIAEIGNEHDQIKIAIKKKEEEQKRFNFKKKQQLGILKNQIIEKDEQISQLNLTRNILEKQVTEREVLLNNLRGSVSWRLTSPLRRLSGIKVVSAFWQFKSRRKIKKSGLFDQAWYLQEYPEVKERGMSPISHYLLVGGKEGKDPGPGFNTAWYLSQYPDVEISGMNPLAHYLMFGKPEGRTILPEFEQSDLAGPAGMSQCLETVDENTESLEDTDNSVADLALIRQSMLFDPEYYRMTNPDVKDAGFDEAEHFYQFGWREGRNPSLDFNVPMYLLKYRDVKDSGTCPLVHFLNFGMQEGRLIVPVEVSDDQCLEKADISDFALFKSEESQLKIAVVCHLYYLDLIDELTGYFNNIPVPYDLIVTTSTEKAAIVRSLLAVKLPDVKLEVISFENRGRDIGPFVILLKTRLADYDLVCKVHSCKSTHHGIVENWRKYLLDHLMGNSPIIHAIIHEFSCHEKTGIIRPVPHPFLTYLGLDKGWGRHPESLKSYHDLLHGFSELKLDELDEDFTFPSGSMFWFRPAALSFLAHSNILLSDFETEDQQSDLPLAHSIEKLFATIGVRAGFENKTVFFSKNALMSVMKPRNLPAGARSILFITHDLCRAGAEILLLTYMNWLYRHTTVKLYLLALKTINESRNLLPEFSSVSRVFLWDEYCSDQTGDKAILQIRNETGPIDLVYGNTVVSSSIYPMLAVFNAPVITHVHELEETIRNLTTIKTWENLKKYTSLFIACSTKVNENLNMNHEIPLQNLVTVNEFIHPDGMDLPEQKSQREKLGLPQDKIIIWGCGTIYWRKGTDLFIETAIRLKKKGLDNFLFYWIGTNSWDVDQSDWGTWNNWEALISQHKLIDTVRFIGQQQKPKNFFMAGDIFFLPSREDPFPLVCLEAAECALPIVCFEGAGGMAEFIGIDAGYSIPILDVEKAANVLEILITNETDRKRLGINARNKLLRRHTDDIAAPEIFELCRQVARIPPAVSVIVSNYNGGFLTKRIESILNQTFKDFELIILDDASSDNSLEIIENYLYLPFVRFYPGETNTANPFDQWHKGYLEAKGQILWFTEAKDFSKPGFLESLFPYFNNQAVGIAYCDSGSTDPAGINDGVGIRNPMPFAGAVLLRKSCLTDEIFSKILHHNSTGDWFIDTQAFNDRDIAFIPENLNFHR